MTLNFGLGDLKFGSGNPTVGLGNLNLGLGDSVGGVFAGFYGGGREIEGRGVSWLFNGWLAAVPPCVGFAG